MGLRDKVKTAQATIRAFIDKLGADQVLILDKGGDRTRVLVALVHSVDPSVKLTLNAESKRPLIYPDGHRGPTIQFDPPSCSPLSRWTYDEICQMFRENKVIDIPSPDQANAPSTVVYQVPKLSQADKGIPPVDFRGPGPQEHPARRSAIPRGPAPRAAVYHEFGTGPRVVEPIDFKFKTEPYAHQREVFLRSRDLEAFALFMEMGTGKTKVVIDNAAYLFAQGKIDGVLVVAPNGIHRNWITKEFPAHCPDWVPWTSYIWNATKSTTKKAKTQLELITKTDKLSVLAINVEAFSTKRGAAVARDFLSSRRVLMAVDESTKIKTPGAKRTKAIIRLRPFSPYRRILTGTPVTQGPFDLYAPMSFLDPHILGFTSFYAFKHYFAVWEKKRNAAQGVDYEELINYVHLDELVALLENHSYRKTKDECIDLPPKTYSSRPVELTADQSRLYKQMSDNLLIEINQEIVTAPIVLTKLLRLSQITGGFVGVDETNVHPIPGGNPKVDALLDIADETQDKIIIWSRFRAEIDLICRALRERFNPEAVVEYHGGIDNETRARNIDIFQNGSARFFVGTPQAGGMGITLTAAGTVVYFSNSYSLEDRLQSEDRAHRIGQTKNVHYIDIEAVGTIDENVVAALRRKQDIAEFINRDKIRQLVNGRDVNNG